jgi:hypothetical protein
MKLADGQNRSTVEVYTIMIALPPIFLEGLRERNCRELLVLATILIIS